MQRNVEWHMQPFGNGQHFDWQTMNMMQMHSRYAQLIQKFQELFKRGMRIKKYLERLTCAQPLERQHVAAFGAQQDYFTVIFNKFSEIRNMALGAAPPAVRHH